MDRETRTWETLSTGITDNVSSDCRKYRRNEQIPQETDRSYIYCHLLAIQLYYIHNSSELTFHIYHVFLNGVINLFKMKIKKRSNAIRVPPIKKAIKVIRKSSDGEEESTVSKAIKNVKKVFEVRR